MAACTEHAWHGSTQLSQPTCDKTRLVSVQNALLIQQAHANWLASSERHGDMWCAVCATMCLPKTDSVQTSRQGRSSSMCFAPIPPQDTGQVNVVSSMMMPCHHQPSHDLQRSTSPAVQLLPALTGPHKPASAQQSFSSSVQQASLAIQSHDAWRSLIRASPSPWEPRHCSQRAGQTRP